MEAELLKSQEVFENEKMAALAAQQAEHESNAQRRGRISGSSKRVEARNSHWSRSDALNDLLK